MATRRGTAFNAQASLAGAIAALIVAAGIWLGSGALDHFDSALIGYATATIFLAFGVVYRYVTWIQSPPTNRYLRRGWQAFLSFGNFRRFPTLVPRSLFSYLTFQTFIARRGRGRWLAHQSLFWGVIVSSLITFPLTFGWISFRSAVGTTYTAYFWNIATFDFNATSPLGWVIFHMLDFTAALTIAGAAYFVWRRFRDQEATTGQRVGYDFFPLLSLIAIAVTGLLLTFSSALLGGAGYEFLAILHMSAVVLTLVFIPFGKFFHVIQRPASIGVDTYKRTSIEKEGVFNCRVCGEPLEATAFVTDLEETMGELGLEFRRWIETCPRCKRLSRGNAYLSEVKEGF